MESVWKKYQKKIYKRRDWRLIFTQHQTFKSLIFIKVKVSKKKNNSKSQWSQIWYLWMWTFIKNWNWVSVSTMLPLESCKSKRLTVSFKNSLLKTLWQISLFSMCLNSHMFFLKGKNLATTTKIQSLFSWKTYFLNVRILFWILKSNCLIRSYVCAKIYLPKI